MLWVRIPDQGYTLTLRQGQEGFCRFPKKEWGYKTGMLPVASPTKHCKSFGAMPEASTLQKDFHNKNRRARAGLSCPRAAGWDESWLKSEADGGFQFPLRLARSYPS